MTMLLAQEDRSVLARIAFALSRESMIPQAEQIFRGLAVSDPSKDGPVVGLALIGIVKGCCAEAVALLDERLAGNDSPIKPQLMLYKLLALGMDGQADKAADIRAAMESEGMTEEVKTADALLDEIGKIRREG